jgi:hypothetical protein
MPTFTQVQLVTEADGRARWRELPIELAQAKPMVALSAPMPMREMQLRQSPPGFQSAFHCTETPQWLFVLAGCMEIGLQDGSTRRFRAGDHFYSADTLPPGTSFDASVHGHCSRAIGEEALVTLFVR